MVKKVIKKLPLLRSVSEKKRIMGTTYGLIFVNFIFQRIFRINSKCKYQVHFTSVVSFADNLRLKGDFPKRSLSICPHCYLQAKNGIEIEEGTMFAPGVQIISANHSKENLKHHDHSKPVKIGKNCWLGGNVVILPGVEIGDNTVVGAGSVVTKSYPEGNLVLVGSPAKPLEK
jgi:acetyltransferase-like isoleucine patch superfamily enzyme